MQAPKDSNVTDPAQLAGKRIVTSFPVLTEVRWNFLWEMLGCSSCIGSECAVDASSTLGVPGMCSEACLVPTPCCAPLRRTHVALIAVSRGLAIVACAGLLQEVRDGGHGEDEYQVSTDLALVTLHGEDGH